jgi:hypothetical protein
VSDEPPPDPGPISTVAEPPRIVELVTEPPRPKPAASTVLELPRVVGRLAPFTPEPEPALSFGARIDPRGVSEVRAGARGAPAIVALARVLIVLFLVAGAVVIAVVIGMGLRTPREDPRRQDLGR